MATETDLDRRISQLGKGMVQVNLRLGRIVELLEQGGGTGGTAGADPSIELLLDLLDAVDHTLAAPAPAVTGWRRWLGSSPAPDLSGLALARDHTLARLAAQGLRPTATTGPVDPHLHRVVETVATQDPALDGVIVRTHRHGWHREGPPVTALRTADVTAWRHAGG